MNTRYWNSLNWKRYVVTTLRLMVGWHLLYEGLSKWIAENWTAAEYLAGATGFMAGFYHTLASSASLMVAVDFLNIYGLLLIGFALFIGIAVRKAASAGIVLLMLYYFAYPPFGASYMMQPEGNLFIVNKILIEAVILLVFIVLRDQGYGLDGYLAGRRQGKTVRGTANTETSVPGRREVLKNLITIPLLGLMSYGAFHNHRKYAMDGITGATIKVGGLDLSELKGELPKGKLGNLELSRLVLGGNLIGGWAHSRDLIYVSSLFKAYNTEKKIFETLILAEQAGIDSINIGFSSNALLQKYKRVTGSKIKVISQVAPDMELNDYFVNINKAIDFGADIIQVQGNHCDWLVRDHKTEKVGLMLDEIRSQGYVAGLGAHSVDALIACEEEGIIPDYYMKTMHHDQYWSAHPRENRVAFQVDGKRSLDHNQFHDNIYCLFPDRTIEFVNRVKVPVMGFKVLAAGAIQPEDGFRWAFENGADFICVGMFDFQLVKDVNITIDILNNLNERQRVWYS